MTKSEPYLNFGRGGEVKKLHLFYQEFSETFKLKNLEFGAKKNNNGLKKNYILSTIETSCVGNRKYKTTGTSCWGLFKRILNEFFYIFFNMFL